MEQVSICLGVEKYLWINIRGEKLIIVDYRMRMEVDIYREEGKLVVFGKTNSLGIHLSSLVWEGDVGCFSCPCLVVKEVSFLKEFAGRLCMWSGN